MFAVTEKYQKLINRFPLRPLESSEDLQAALEISMELNLAYSKLDESEMGYLAILSDIIEKYEDATVSAGKTGLPAHEMLTWLMETNGLTKTKLSDILGVRRGRASELCSGTRALSKAHIAALSKYFNVPADVFLAPKQAGKPKAAADTIHIGPQLFQFGGPNRPVAAKAMKAGSTKKKGKKDEQHPSKPLK